MLVRLCDAMTTNLFGMDARAFKKMAQTDPDRVAVIQVTGKCRRSWCAPAVLELVQVVHSPENLLNATSDEIELK